MSIKKIVYEFDTIDELREFEAKASEIILETKIDAPVEAVPKSDAEGVPKSDAEDVQEFEPGYFWSETEDNVLRNYRPKAAQKALKKIGSKRTLHGIYVRRVKLGITSKQNHRLKAHLPEEDILVPQKKKYQGDYHKAAERMKWVNKCARQLVASVSPTKNNWESARALAMNEYAQMRGEKQAQQPTMEVVAPVPEPEKKVKRKVTFPDFPDLTPASVVRLKELCAHCAYGTPITYSTAEAYLSLEKPLVWTEKVWDKFKADFLAHSNRILDYFQIAGTYKVSDNKIFYDRQG